jgi:hypothetical protein
MMVFLYFWFFVKMKEFAGLGGIQAARCPAIGIESNNV